MYSSSPPYRLQSTTLILWVPLIATCAVQLVFVSRCLAVCISLVVAAILPVPVVFALRYFNIIDDNAGGLSTVSYKKGRIIKESARAEEDDDASLIAAKSPSEAPSPMPGNSIYRKPSSGVPDADMAPNGRYGIGYLMADMPDMPESDL